MQNKDDSLGKAQVSGSSAQLLDPNDNAFSSLDEKALIDSEDLSKSVAPLNYQQTLRTRYEYNFFKPKTLITVSSSSLLFKPSSRSQSSGIIEPEIIAKSTKKPLLCSLSSSESSNSSSSYSYLDQANSEPTFSSTTEGSKNSHHISSSSSSQSATEPNSSDSVPFYDLTQLQLKLSSSSGSYYSYYSTTSKSSVSEKFKTTTNRRAP